MEKRLNDLKHSACNLLQETVKNADSERSDCNCIHCRYDTEDLYVDLYTLRDTILEEIRKYEYRNNLNSKRGKVQYYTLLFIEGCNTDSIADKNGKIYKFGSRDIDWVTRIYGKKSAIRGIRISSNQIEDDTYWTNVLEAADYNPNDTIGIYKEGGEFCYIDKDTFDTILRINNKLHSSSYKEYKKIFDDSACNAKPDALVYSYILDKIYPASEMTYIRPIVTVNMFISTI